MLIIYDILYNNNNTNTQKMRSENISYGRADSESVTRTLL